MDLDDGVINPSFLVGDRDTQYVAKFDEVFRSEGAEIVKTPLRTPNANAYAERFVRTVRAECLDHLLVLNARHLQRLLRHYLVHYNHHRPHQGTLQQVPAVESARRLAAVPPTIPMQGHDGRFPARIVRRDRLGGLIHEYQRAP